MTAFETLWPTILDVGRHTSTGGYRRYAWSDADLTLREWFSDCAAEREFRKSSRRMCNQV